MKRYYVNIQILRAILFFCVLFFHCGVPYFEFGWGGVEAFFLISAFFATNGCYSKSDFNLLAIIKKRIIRLYPPYVLIIIIAALFAILSRKVPYDIVSHLFSAQNYQWIATSYSSPMQPFSAHTWTLSIEVWTGFILLLILKVCPKNKLRFGISLMFMVGILFRISTIFFGCNVYVVSLCPLAYLDIFACGALLAIFNKENKLRRERLIAVGICGVIGVVATIFSIAHRQNSSFLEGYQSLVSPSNYLDNIFTGNIYLFIALIIYGVLGLMLLCEKNKNRKTDNFIYKAGVYLGNISYNLYLFHWPILVVIKHFISTWYILVPLVFLATLLASIIFEICILQLKNKRRVIT